MDVGVREFKQHLSKYLDRVQQGESLRITDRGQPKAVVMPIASSIGIEAGISEGWIRPSKSNGLQPARPVPSKLSIRDVLADDRGQ